MGQEMGFLVLKIAKIQKLWLMEIIC